jgi:hypothetical protein
MSDEISPECHSHSSHTGGDWRSSTGRGIATDNRRSASPDGDPAPVNKARAGCAIGQSIALKRAGGVQRLLYMRDESLQSSGSFW